MYSTVNYKDMQRIKHFFIRVKNFSIGTPTAIIIASLILGASHLGYGYLQSNPSNHGPVTMFKGKAVSDADFLTGNKKSKVVVVEYSDTECPYCAQLHPSMKQLQEEYGEKVAFAYRYFPLTQIHPNSFEESRAIECVGTLSGSEVRQKYIDTIFDIKYNAKNMTFAKGQKESLAKGLGVDEQALATCMKGQTSSDTVNASIQDGITAGVQGTPATFILLKNKKGYEVIASVDGARPFEFLKAAVEEALAR